ncbi:MAG: YkgJ family cysteine cluster protein [Desulfovibrio sp.]|nr:YkgJ family cysteine cluster protein [Desulfovibrio sp.]
MVKQLVFPCDRCGECCRNLRLFGKPYEWLLDAEGRACRYFNQRENLCSIYPIRPLICNIEVGRAVFYKDVSPDEFIKSNIQGCIFLKNIAAKQ